MVIKGPEAIDAAPFRAAAQRRMSVGRLSCPARRPTGPGKKVGRQALRLRRSRRSRPSARSVHQETAWVCALIADPTGDLANVLGSKQGKNADGALSDSPAYKTARTTRSSGRQYRHEKSIGIVDLRRAAVECFLNESGNGKARLIGNRARSPIADKKRPYSPARVCARCVMVMT